MNGRAEYSGAWILILAASWLAGCATRAFQSSDHSSYSTIFSPFSQCSTCGPFTMMRASFHSPIGRAIAFVGAFSA